MRDAVAELVHDGDTVAIEGFTHRDEVDQRLKPRTV
jgi:acyl CoA:acetate/3-ketoacid CoA transferase alpha subunit